MNLNEIPESKDFLKVEEINKGWSSDRKFYIKTNTKPLMLRVSDASKQTRMAAEYNFMLSVYNSGVRIPKPLFYGLFDNDSKVYILLGWCEGVDANDVLMGLDNKTQYDLDYLAGQYMKKIHDLPCDKDIEPWDLRYKRKIDKKLEEYKVSSLKYENDTSLLNFVELNQHLIKGRPSGYMHGDYHVGNMIINKDNDLSIIDFNRLDIGDPWDEFNRIVWSAQISPAFASGQINGYFEDDVPENFFRLMMLYICVNTLSSLPWSVKFGEAEITTMRNQEAMIKTWYDNYENVIPNWYVKKVA